MDVRRLGAGLVVAASSLLLMAGTASAHGSAASAQAAEGTTCAVHSLPSFVAQGEFENQATVADVIEVECNPFVYGTGSKVTVTASQLYSRCDGNIEWIDVSGDPISDRSIELALDADGNATVALIAGPECQAGESLISLHMDEGEYNSYTTSFTVLPPNDTALGVTALPSHQVEDSQTSSVATIIEAEFPGAAEASVRIGSEEFYRRCGYDPKLVWISPEEFEPPVEGVVRQDEEPQIGPEYDGLRLDNNGNGFVIALGLASCSPGSSLIEADLEEKPFTTVTTNFLIESPKPTEY